MLAYYPDRYSPLLVSFGSQGVTGTLLLELCTELGAVAELAPDNTGGNLELGAVAQWMRRHCLRPLWWDLHLASLLAHLLFFLSVLIIASISCCSFVVRFGFFSTSEEMVWEERL